MQISERRDLKEVLRFSKEALRGDSYAGLPCLRLTDVRSRLCFHRLGNGNASRRMLSGWISIFLPRCKTGLCGLEGFPQRDKSADTFSDDIPLFDRLLWAYYEPTRPVLVARNTL